MFQKVLLKRKKNYQQWKIKTTVLNFYSLSGAVSCLSGFDVEIAQFIQQSTTMVQCETGEVCASLSANLSVSVGFSISGFLFSNI